MRGDLDGGDSLSAFRWKLSNCHIILWFLNIRHGKNLEHMRIAYTYFSLKNAARKTWESVDEGEG